MIQFFMGTTIGVLIGMVLSALMVMAERQDAMEEEWRRRNNETEDDSENGSN